MRRVICIAIMLMLVMPAIVLARDCNTSKCACDTPKEREHQNGIGADVTLWQNSEKSVGLELQEKYDFSNRENALYAVVKIDPWKLFGR